jgi:hypothetical protein
LYTVCPHHTVHNKATTTRGRGRVDTIIEEMMMMEERLATLHRCQDAAWCRRQDAELLRKYVNGAALTEKKEEKRAIQLADDRYKRMQCSASAIVNMHWILNTLAGKRSF